MRLGQSGEAATSTSLNYWRAPTGEVSKSQRSTACAVSQFHPFPRERSFTPSDWQRRLLSRRLLSSWNESSTAWVKCGWFFTLGRMTRLTPCLPGNLNGYLPSDAHERFIGA